MPSGIDPTSIAALSAVAGQGLDETAKLLADLRAGKGTLGRLFTDDAAYRDLDALMVSATRVTDAVERFVDHGACPCPVHVGIVRVAVRQHQMGAGRTRRNFADRERAVVTPEPLHVREAGLEAKRRDGADAERSRIMAELPRRLEALHRHCADRADLG